jgi:succinyl-diaminopimelate desuccinylase
VQAFIEHRIASRKPAAYLTQEAWLQGVSFYIDERAIHDETGIDTELSTTGGTSDGRFIAQVCPQVIELGPPNATIHKINEFVAVADLDPLKNIYRRVLEQLHGLASQANTSAQ